MLSSVVSPRRQTSQTLPLRSAALWFRAKTEKIHRHKNLVVQVEEEGKKKKEKNEADDEGAARQEHRERGRPGRTGG